MAHAEKTHVSAQSSAGKTEASATGPVRRRWLILLLSVGAGFLLTVVWSAEFVDRTIGGNIARTALGHDPEAPISGAVAGIVFAFTSGLAGTFTACNIAVFGTVAPILGAAGSRWGRMVQALKPLGWMSLGMITVSALYGALVGVVGTSMPQFSEAESAPGVLSGRSVQSMVAFGAVGMAMLYMGLSALGFVRDPFERLRRRFPNVQSIFMGALIGGFLIGRPYPLFRQLFRDAAESGNVLYGAAAFTLQSVGNIALMSVVFVALTVVAGGRMQAWLARPGRAATLIAVTLIVAGAFTILYWDIRLLARREIIPWYPVAPWAA
ncbi:hypothetical protein DSC45_34375 [Streptomyces sp. YIM 130001]|uniref:hypothetical protein n=1 Tax=Streptomyces sp. YIM 130001 TaxID=2259644 RepID=UPI000E64B610|nr:hypothetical protein [Streptomyces sp. YIM 130001]RII07914.1 hypothetical protein DSC45_34375 [Streptomyces sp. YIM 130001]